MKLSALVRYKNQISAMSTGPAQRSANDELEKIVFEVGSQNIALGNYAQSLAQRQQEISSAFDKFEQELHALKQEIKQLVEQAEKPWFAESYRLFEQEMIYETVDYVLNRRPEITEELKNFYVTRISRYSNWQYPAMIIRPGLEDFIDHMVACDPLYLVDEKYELLDPALKKYNEVYQRRLRPYTVRDRNNDNILEKLPDGQFGLVFAYNFFNFRPFEVIRQWLTEIYSKLRPGGILIMSFNDCDRDKGVMLVEQHFCCYTPGSLILELSQSLGYEKVFSWHNDGPTTWLEMKKPGEMHSLRGGQALAKIMPK
jgi:SAM-dependent methyltransferase